VVLEQVAPQEVGTWRGFCNKCGLCCTRVVDGVPTRCAHLDIRSRDQADCLKYGTRYEGMPVALVDPKGTIRADAECHPAYPHGLKAGTVLPGSCSYVETP
jgi:uncharacterized cysteine cluster protein YcgN (CxxCxxCC family)